MVTTPGRLAIEDITICCDTREQRLLAFPPNINLIIKKLDVADYSVLGLEDKIAIEKKSLDDLCACIGRERDRFERMLDKLREFPYRAIVVTADWSHIDLKYYRGGLHQNTIYGTLMAWAMTCQVPIMFMGDEHRAGIAVARMCYVAANRLYRAGEFIPGAVG